MEKEWDQSDIKKEWNKETERERERERERLNSVVYQFILSVLLCVSVSNVLCVHNRAISHYFYYRHKADLKRGRSQLGTHILHCVDVCTW